MATFMTNTQSESGISNTDAFLASCIKKQNAPFFGLDAYKVIVWISK